jgi:hypothetical protein
MLHNQEEHAQDHISTSITKSITCYRIREKEHIQDKVSTSSLKSHPMLKML